MNHEQEALGDAREAKDVVKSSIVAAFAHFIGSTDMPGRSTHVFVRPDGSLVFMLFATALRLDAAGHIVALAERCREWRDTGHVQCGRAARGR